VNIREGIGIGNEFLKIARRVDPLIGSVDSSLISCSLGLNPLIGSVDSSLISCSLGLSRFDCNTGFLGFECSFGDSLPVNSLLSKTL